MNKTIEDLLRVEDANFTACVKIVASSAISSLHYIKELALRMEIPVVDLTAAHIIEDMKNQDLLARRLKSPLITINPMDINS